MKLFSYRESSLFKIGKIICSSKSFLIFGDASFWFLINKKTCDRTVGLRLNSTQRWQVLFLPCEASCFLINCRKTRQKELAFSRRSQHSFWPSSQISKTESIAKTESVNIIEKKRQWELYLGIPIYRNHPLILPLLDLVFMFW